MEIRDKRLYRASHGTFEAYCKEHWGTNWAHAYRLIESAEITDNLSPVGDIPKTECQDRPLTQRSPEEQHEAWSRAVETAPEGKVTAKHVETVVSFFLPCRAGHGTVKPRSAGHSAVAVIDDGTRTAKIISSAAYVLPTSKKGLSRFDLSP